MKIAITGGTGLLGRYVIDYIKENYDYTPIVFSRQNNGNYQNVEVRQTNYSVENLTKNLEDIDFVIHLASQRGNLSYFDEYLDNVSMTQNLYEACLRNKIYNIVYASSISTYSKLNKLPWNEEDIPQPLTMYGISKLCGELIGNLYNEKYMMKVKNLRFAHLFGRNEKNDYMINKFIRQAYNKEKIMIYSVQNARREFLYAKDAARAVLCALLQKDKHGTYNIGGNDILTNIEVAEKINKAFKNNGNIAFDNRAEELLDCSYMNKSKAEIELNFKQKYSFYEAMVEIYGEMINV